jgi:hypothetical protein
MTLWFAPLGVPVAYRLDVPQLKPAFAALICLVETKTVLG